MTSNRLRLMTRLSGSLIPHPSSLPSRRGTPARSSSCLEVCVSINQNTDDEAEEGCPFQQGGDDQHGRLNAAGNFGLPGHALQGGGPDAAEADAGAEDRDGRPDTGADGTSTEDRVIRSADLEGLSRFVLILYDIGKGRTGRRQHYHPHQTCPLQRFHEDSILRAQVV